MNSSQSAAAMTITSRTGVSARKFCARRAARQASEIPRKLASKMVLVKKVRKMTCAGNHRIHASSRKSRIRLIKNSSAPALDFETTWPPASGTTEASTLIVALQDQRELPSNGSDRTESQRSYARNAAHLNTPSKSRDVPRTGVGCGTTTGAGHQTVACIALGQVGRYVLGTWRLRRKRAASVSVWQSARGFYSCLENLR